MAKTGLPWNTDFPHIPTKMDVAKDPACAGCAVRNLHKTCAGGVRPNAPLSREEAIILAELSNAHWGVERRDMDADGIKGSAGDSWYNINGRDTINYVYFSTWTVISTSGDTAVLETTGEDPGEVVWNTYTFPSPDDTITPVTGGQVTCAITPGHARGVFTENSILAWKSRPLVVEVTGCDKPTKRLTVKFDRDVDAALTTIDPGDTNPVSILLYQYASPPAWQYIIKPDYFPGEKKTLKLSAAKVPTAPIDGVYTLEADRPVADKGFDPLNPVFTFEGKRRDNGNWETVPEAENRLFILPDKTYLAFKDLKPAEGNSTIPLSVDLTADYSDFRVTYYRYVSEGRKGCQVVSYARCRYSLPAKAIPGYAGRPGVADSGAYVCMLRVYDDKDLVDNVPDPENVRETAIPWQASPTGILRYPASGLCTQKNCCSHYQSAVDYVGRDSNFNYEKQISRITKELAGAANHRIFQPMPTIPDKQAERVQHASLAYLAGYVDLETPPGIHPQATFSGNGTFAWPLIVTAPDGSESIVEQRGAFHNFNSADPETASDGQFPLWITAFKNTRDPLNQAGIHTQQDLERIGIGVERDTGTLLGHGIGSSSVAVLPQDLIFAVNCDTTLLDTIQTKALGSFVRHSDASPAQVRIAALRPDAKFPETIGSRELAVAPADEGGGIVALECKNVLHGWGQPDLGETEDESFTWHAGGDLITCPPPPQREIANYYEVNKSTGGTTRGVQRGDAAAITIGGTLRYFAVYSVDPHGGAAAADYGPGGFTPLASFSKDGIYTTYAKNQDVFRILDPEGHTTGLPAGTSISFLKNAVVILPGAVLEWTTYNTDNWQEVEGATHYYGEALWEIPDAWFSDKPAGVCFRARDCEWMDHRGLVPASLYNKLLAMVDQLEWVSTYFSASAIGEFQYAAYKERINNQDGTHSEAYYIPSTHSGGNAIGGGTSPPSLPYNTSNDFASMNFTGDAISLPLLMQHIPDYCIIVEAWVELKVTSAVLETYEGEWEDDPANPGGKRTGGTTTTTNVTTNFMVMAGTGDPDSISWSVYGGLPTPPVGSLQKVVVITDFLAGLYAARNSNVHSFAIVPAVPAITEGGSIADALDALMGSPPPRADIDVNGDGVITPNGTPFQEPEENCIASWSGSSIEYGEITLGKLAIRYRYPNEEKVRGLVVPRLPSMADVVPAGKKRYADGSLADL